MRQSFMERAGRKESGSVIVIFAISLSVLLTFVSFALDIGMVNMKKAQMMDLCQQIRAARMTAKDYIMNSNDPAKMIYDISNQCAMENGFEGELKIYYKEVVVPGASPNWVNSRTYYVRIELQQKHDFIFPAALITGGSKTIHVNSDGGEKKSSSRVAGEAYVPVWSPGTIKNGSWRRSDSHGAGLPNFELNEWPSDFTE